jgi:hypothetical protein
VRCPLARPVLKTNKRTRELSIGPTALRGESARLRAPEEPQKERLTAEFPERPEVLSIKQSQRRRAMLDREASEDDRQGQCILWRGKITSFSAVPPNLQGAIARRLGDKTGLSSGPDTGCDTRILQLNRY